MDLDALAGLAANTIVAVAATDAFEGLRSAVARLFGRGTPDPGAGRRLDATRELLTAAAPGERADAAGGQARQWQVRLADLIADHPAAADELRALLARFPAPPAGVSGDVVNTISGTVNGGPVLMGRDFGDVTIGRPEGHPHD